MVLANPRAAPLLSTNYLLTGVTLIVKLYSIRRLTVALDSISGVSSYTRTLEAAHSVSALGVSATSTVLCFTLVDIWNITDQQTQLHETISSGRC